MIVWDWGWHGHGDAPDIIARLPKSVWLMSVSEWALPIDRGGVKTTVGEYSHVGRRAGPAGDCATGSWPRRPGLKTVAKVQLNNTWELSTVPYLPVMDLVAEHCHNLASAGVDGMMLSWSLGGYPSPNLEIAARFSARCESRRPAASTRCSTPWPPNATGPRALRWRERPGPPSARRSANTRIDCRRAVQLPGASRPGQSALSREDRLSGDDDGNPLRRSDGWRGPYPAEVFAAQFEKVAEGWRSGIPALKAAVEKAPPDRRDEAQAELRFAQAADTNFQSVANQTRFVLARDALADPSQKLSPEERRRLRDEIKRCLESEIALARQLFTLTSEDSRIGFEAANQYFYLPLDLVEKVINCRWLLEQYGD